MASEIDMLLERTNETIARLRDELRLEERLRQRLLEVKGQQVSGPLLAATGQGKPTGRGGYRPAGSLADGSLVSRIVNILRTSGRPMKTAQIAQLLTAQGYSTRAKAGLKIAISSTLAHKQDRFFHREARGLYSLRPELMDKTDK